MTFKKHQLITFYEIRVLRATRNSLVAFRLRAEFSLAEASNSSGSASLGLANLELPRWTSARVFGGGVSGNHKRPFVGVFGGRSWTFLSTFGEHRPRFVKNLSTLTFEYPTKGLAWTTQRVTKRISGAEHPKICCLIRRNPRMSLRYCLQ